MSQFILLVEDELTLSKNIRSYLARFGYEVRAATTAEAGITELDSFKPDAVILDFHLPGMNGLEALARIREIDRGIKVIMITGHGSIDLAVDAMKAGAYDFVAKPVSLGKLKLLLERAIGEERRDQALSYYQRKAGADAGLDDLVGESLPMRTLRQKVSQILEAENALHDSDAPAVLIRGETGTGKELVARALHFAGPRRDKPFVELNCASLPEQLLESELFGHERGAFTDAREKKLGLVETAEGGTLFLDEIGDMAFSLQAKLLKLLEEKTMRRIGSVRDQHVNVRIMAATHRPLEELVRDGKFRSDLFFRLRIVQIEIPPLRDRGEDAMLLARHFLAIHGARYGRANLSFDPSAAALLCRHRWPGNVRELRNVVEQAVLLATSPTIQDSQLNLCSSLLATANEDATETAANLDINALGAEDVSLETIERTVLLRALARTEWNVTQAARLLGVSRDTLRYRIDKFRLAPSA